MTTGLVRCDHCEKAVKQEEAHGWLDVRVWVTKPTQDNLEQLRQDPTMAKILDAQGITSAELPALVGGDFCTIDHLVKFYQAQATLEGVSKEDKPQPTVSKDEAQRRFNEWLAKREPPDDPDDFVPPIIESGP